MNFIKSHGEAIVSIVSFVVLLLVVVLVVGNNRFSGAEEAKESDTAVSSVESVCEQTTKSPTTTTSVTTTTGTTTTTSSVAINTTVKPSAVVEACSARVDLQSRKTYKDYGALSEKERDLFEKIIGLYEQHLNESGTSEWIPFESITAEEYYDIADFACLYYGDLTDPGSFVDVESVNGGQRCSIMLNIDNYKRLRKQRLAAEAKVDAILSELNDGSETDVLLQFSRYIGKNMSYKRQSNNLSHIVETKTGNCNSFSVLFRMCAERIGVRCDFVTGIASNGENHAWNRVFLSDGSVRYYDLSFYLSSKDERYLNMTASPFQIKTVNTYGYGG